MVLRLFGLKKKDKTQPPAAAPAASQPAPEPVEFQEVPGAPAAASAKTVDVPSGGAKAGKKAAAKKASPKSAAKKAPKKAAAKKTAQGKKTASKKR